MDEPLIRLLELLLRYRGRVVGTLVGLLVAWLVVAYGVWQALAILACGFVGYLAGTELDRRGSVARALRRFWRGTRH